MLISLPNGLSDGCFEATRDGLMPTESATLEERKTLEEFNIMIRKRFEEQRKKQEEQIRQVENMM